MVDLLWFHSDKGLLLVAMDHWSALPRVEGTVCGRGIAQGRFIWGESVF